MDRKRAYNTLTRDRVGEKRSTYPAITDIWVSITIQDGFIITGMRMVKKAPLVIGGTLAGIIALRSVRKRRSRDTEAEPEEAEPDAPEPEPEEAEQEGPRTASEHAKAAVEHTRQAAQKSKRSLPRTAE